MGEGHGDPNLVVEQRDVDQARNDLLARARGHCDVGLLAGDHRLDHPRVGDQHLDRGARAVTHRHERLGQQRLSRGVADSKAHGVADADQSKRDGEILHV